MIPSREVRPDRPIEAAAPCADAEALTLRLQTRLGLGEIIRDGPSALPGTH
jgi:hypothetical protein